MASVQDTLNRLATTFTVRDIMVHVAELTCAENESDAASVSSEHPEFNVIPIRADGTLTAYFDRDSHEVGTITLNDLISGGTSLRDVIEILEDRHFAFVVGHRNIEGYVHYSDLNHHLVKLTMYVLLEAVERFALQSLSATLTYEYLVDALGKSRAKQVQDALDRAGDAGRSLSNYLNISDLLQLAMKEGTIQVRKDTIKDMKDVRDGAAHAMENLVDECKPPRRLAEVKRECVRLLGDM
jgi:hypothetical protein